MNGDSEAFPSANDGCLEQTEDRDMLKHRLLSSAILISIAFALFWLDYNRPVAKAPGVWLLPLLMFFATGTTWEMASMLRSAGHPIRPMIAVIGGSLIAASTAVPFLWAFSEEPYPADCPIGRLGWIVLSANVVVFVVLLAEIRTYGKEPEADLGQAIRRTCTAVFVSIYVGMPMAMLVALRTMHADQTDGKFGFAALITMVAVTKVADSGAYFSGKLLGRHKLIPRLSPGKTIEGAIGGIASSTILAYCCLKWLFPEADSQSGALASPLFGAVLLGPTLAICGMVGDLGESLFKRESAVKDSGKLLPGLGGVWDVTD
ncbi:MAG: phosphatidate cytidylyltransferase, partial [Planctomycetota bacterium]